MSRFPTRRLLVAVACLGVASLGVPTASAQPVSTSTSVDLGTQGRIQAHRQAFLNEGESLGANELIQSPNKVFGLWLKPSGAVAIIRWTSEHAADEIWSSGTTNVAKIFFDGQGIMRFLDAQGQQVYASDSPQAAPAVAAQLRITNDGQLVITHDDAQVWQLRRQGPSPEPQPERENAVYPGKVLGVGFAVYSTNKKFYLSISPTGNLYLFDHAKQQILWQTNTSGKSEDATFSVTTDGNARLLDKSGAVIWQSDTAKADVVSPRLVVRDSGVLELMHGQTKVWSSVVEEQDPGAVLTPSMTLSQGESLVSRNGKFSLMVTTQGGLLISTIGRPTPAWQPDLKGRVGAKLALTPTGNLQLVDAATAVVWESATVAATETQARAVLRNSGVLEIMHGAVVVWRSHQS